MKTDGKWIIKNKVLSARQGMRALFLIIHIARDFFT